MKEQRKLRSKSLSRLKYYKRLVKKRDTGKDQYSFGISKDQVIETQNLAKKLAKTK